MYRRLLIVDKWNGTFTEVRPLTATGGKPVAIAVGDLNQDSIDDIVVAYEDTDILGIILSSIYR